ncbi:hypothetical protein BURCENBC7_AP4490 [Burkholderia cenocepacia BC7]|nr:hypothetical protein BURCENK562V_C4944 [Burkholderia cenocepacia K56-2Valvano]ERI25809.1 hypothetical protein BURCENBC7_AP4490 [Burkholderia cenocepacia BC7]
MALVVVRSRDAPRTGSGSCRFRAIGRIAPPDMGPPAAGGPAPAQV